MDLALCKKSGGSVASSAEVTPTTTKTTTTTTSDACTGTIADYNSDGIVNSLDRINCLQSQE